MADGRHSRPNIFAAGGIQPGRGAPNSGAWARSGDFFLAFFQCQRQQQRMDRMDGTSTARAGFRFVGLLLAGVWHCLSGDLPPPTAGPCPAWPRVRPENSDAGTDRSCHHCNPGRRPCPLEGPPQPVPVLFFIVTSVDARTNIYIRSHPPAAAIVPLCCLLSCFPLRLRIENCRLPTVDCRRLSTPRP